MSLGGQLAAAMAVQNIAINNIMLSNPQMVFVLSMGNNGPALMTGGNPGGSSMAITVSALTEAPMITVEPNFVGGGINSNAMPVAANSMTAWGVVPGTNRMFNTFNRLPQDGNFRIFAAPHAGSLAATGTADIPIASFFGAAGVFTAEINALYDRYGAEALAGAFVLVRRPANDNQGLPNAPLIVFSPATGGAPAHPANLGGVIFIDGTSPTTTPRNVFSQNNMVPTLMIDNASGRALLQSIQDSPNGYVNFSLQEGEVAEQVVIGFSGRGPNEQSFEIKPEAGAHGVNVLSAVPRWAVATNWKNNPMGRCNGL
jgi:hypothetical protein